MYKRVLLAYDGTREGRMALREGARLVLRFGAEAFLLAIVPPLVAADVMGTPIVTPSEHDLILQEGLSRAAELGLSVNGKVVHGAPLDEIKRMADELEVDLVVVGHRKRSFLERWWSGPSHGFLIDHLSCSLLISNAEHTDLASS
jgi:nucleotide-binding universal stress UspA family protein